MINLKEKKIDFYIDLLFTLTRASEVLLNKIDQELPTVGKELIQKDKQNFNRFHKMIKDVISFFDRSFEDCYLQESIEDYERLRGDANETIRLLLTYVKKTARNPEVMTKIFNFMNRLSKKDDLEFIEQKDIDEFNLLKR